MAATKQDIARWIQAGKERGHKWMIVKYDSWDHEDYPVYVDDYDKYVLYTAGDKVMEVYDLTMDAETQLNEYRAYHPPAQPNQEAAQ